MFQGLNEDTYQFFWEIAFNNEQSFYEANKERYRKNVYEPLKELAIALTPIAQEIDGAFNIRPSSVVSHSKGHAVFERQDDVSRSRVARLPQARRHAQRESGCLRGV